MGLTIHYSGSFNPEASLKEMIEEVKDIAEIYRWEYAVFDNEFPENESDKEVLTKRFTGYVSTRPVAKQLAFAFYRTGE